ncbi:MAG: hypothetical protein WBA45_06095 [Microthrixaceae bacterium]
MGDATDEVLVAQAVAEAVRRAGTNVVSEPRRIQGMVSDVLGAQARTRRGEIDAVVRAASEQIPERLMSNSIDVEGAVAILSATGLDNATADFAVQVWSYALGLLEAEAEPPTLTRSIENTSSRDDSSAFGFDDGAVAATVLPESVVVEEPEQAAEPLVPTFEPEPAVEQVLPAESALPDHDPVTEDPLTGQLPVGYDAARYDAAGYEAAEYDAAVNDSADLSTPDRAGHKSRQPVLLGAVGVVLLMAAIGAIALWMGKDSEPTRVSSAAKQVSVEFTDTATPVGTVSRTWTVDGDALIGELVIANRTDKSVSGQHYEVVPKSLVPKASAIKSEPAHKVIKDDPVIAWDISLKPKEKAEFRYTIKVDAKSDVKQLNKWKADQLKADKEFSAERAALPRVKVISPAGLQLTENTFTLTGTTDPTSTVEIADVKPGGRPAIKPVVGSDGRWSHVISGLGLGENVLKVVATSRFGATSSVSYSVVVQLPVVPPADVKPEVLTRPQDTSASKKATTSKTPSGGGSGTVPPPPPVVTTTTAPKPPPTPLRVSISGSQNWYIPPDGLVCNYTLSVNINVPWSSIRWSGGSYYNDKTSANFDTNGLHAGSATVTATVTSRDGQTKTASLAINLIPGTPNAC